MSASNVRISTSPGSRFGQYLRSPAIQESGDAFLARSPGAAAYLADGETGAHVLLRGLALFSDPSRLNEQRAALGLPASATRSEALRAFAAAVGMTSSQLADSLEAVSESMTADRLFDKIEKGDADAARARAARTGAGAKAATREQLTRKPNEEEVRRADLEAAIDQNGGIRDGSRRLYQPSNAMQTDIALSMWRHGALDRQIDIAAPGSEAWAKDGAQGERTRTLMEAMEGREASAAAAGINEYLFGRDDEPNGNDTNANQREVTNDD